MKRYGIKFFFTLLGAALLMGLLSFSALAAGSLTLGYTVPENNTTTLSIEGLEANAEVSAVELTMILPGEYSDLLFRATDTKAYQIYKAPVVQNGKTELTLYVVNPDRPLNRGTTLSLGTLSLGEEKTGKAFSMPDKVTVTLLDDALHPLPNADSTQIPTGERTAPPIGGGGGGGDFSGGFAVTIAPFEHGRAETDLLGADEGLTVTLTVTPDPGYTISGVTVKGSDGTEIPITPLEEGKYQFVMPAMDVTIQVTLLGGEMPFTDVKPTDWFHEAAQYVYEHNLMNGTTATTFSPQSTATRGMTVTVLYRMEGSPRAGKAPFSDVSGGEYYASAVAWAAEHGIVDGYPDGTFQPGRSITREQMACILYRYAGYKGYDVTKTADLSAYEDAGKIHSYAVQAMQWANASDLIRGRSKTTLVPTGNVTRAEMASLLMRFQLNVAVLPEEEKKDPLS